MNESIAARDAVLTRLVAIKNTHSELMTRQVERLDAIVINDVPDNGFVEAERDVTARLAELADEFSALAEGFPSFVGTPGVVTEKVEETSRWFGFRRSHEVLREAVSPDLPEARLQEARLDHLLGAFIADLGTRRVALQHASYTVKRAVVGLNQAAAFSLDSDGTRVIERERHALETLVSIVDRIIVDLVIVIRRVEGIASGLSRLDRADGDAHPPLSEGDALMLAG